MCICDADIVSPIPSNKIVKHSVVIDDIDVIIKILEDLNQFNPLIEPLPWWYGLSQTNKVSSMVVTL